MSDTSELFGGGAVEAQVRLIPDAPPELRIPVERKRRRPIHRASIFGVRLARFTYDETLQAVDWLIERGKPSYFITANLNYVMLSNRDSRLPAVNRRAAFILADGMPLVWYSRLTGRPLPERVTGADLIHLLAERASQRRWSVFLLGGDDGVAEETAEVFKQRYPGLHVAGIESPILGQLTPKQHEELIRRIRDTRCDLLLVALGQPKGELWLAENCDALQVPACVQLGASFDFVAGRVARAPKWAQRIGAEWLYRICREPLRMLPRYWSNATFLAGAIVGDVARRTARRLGRLFGTVR